jgi:hypothetical protein
MTIPPTVAAKAAALVREPGHRAGALHDLTPDEIRIVEESAK